MKKRLLVMALLWAATFQACTVQDHVLPEPTILPTAVRQVIDQRYPGHSALTESELWKGKIFMVKFEFNGATHTLVSNNTEILESRRTMGELPDSLKVRINGTALQGGTFSNYRVSYKFSSPDKMETLQNLIDYTVNGITYSGAAGTNAWYLMDQTDLSYPIHQATDLPDSIQTFLNDRNKPNPTAIAALPLLNNAGKNILSQNNELKFLSATGWVMHGGKRYYELSVIYYGMTTLQLLFDGSGKLVWSSSFRFLERFPTLDAPSTSDSNLSPDQIQELKGKVAPPEIINAFTPIPGLFNWKDDYAGTESYSGAFEHSLPGGRDERWYLRYNAGKNLIWRTFYY